MQGYSNQLKIVEFFHMWHIIFEIEFLNVAFDKRPFFVFQVLNSSVHGSLAPIWCQMILTFSGQHFYFPRDPWILNRGFQNPKITKNCHFPPLCSITTNTNDITNLQSSDATPSADIVANLASIVLLGDPLYRYVILKLINSTINHYKLPGLPTHHQTVGAKMS